MTITVSEGGISITATAIRCGGDLNVSVFGGDSPHIGSVSTAVPRPSLTGDGSVSATVSTHNLTGHKDNAVGDMFAELLATRLNCVCVVTCGIHIDDISPYQLQLVLELSKRALEKLTHILQ